MIKTKCVLHGSEWIEKAVVQADSPTLGRDIEAAFRWNVQRILEGRK